MSIFKLFGQKKDVKKPKKTDSQQNPKLQPITAKPPSEVHGTNQFDTQLKQTDLLRAYENAELKLQDKSYAERKYKTKENIIKVRSFYPYLSVFLSLSVGILTGDLFASGLTEVAYYLTLGLLACATFLVAWLLEDLKRDACRDYFSSFKPTARQRFWLNTLFLYSMIISGIGGFVASIHLNDKSADIEANYQQQSDSVSTDYDEQVAVLDAIIKENQNRMNAPSKWARYHAQKDLAEAQKQKMELQKTQNESLSTLKTEKKDALTADDMLNQYKAYIIVFVVFILELLYIRSYAYEYAVEKKIKEENRNHNFVKPSQETLPSNAPLTLQDVAMQMLMAQITGQVPQFGQNQAMSPQVQNQGGNVPYASGHQTNVGFQFQKTQASKGQQDKVTLHPTIFCINPECRQKKSPGRADKLCCSDACRKKMFDCRKDEGITFYYKNENWFKQVLPNPVELEYWKNTRFDM